MEWDDLRYVLAVRRAGTLAGAARTLGVSHVTVFRRVEQLEKTLGVRLFDRKRQGYVATPALGEIIDQAEQIEDQVNAIERRIWRQDQEIQGTVRLTTTDTIANVVLPKILTALHQENPRLSVDLLTSCQQFNITKRDADIAIRYTVAPPEMLIGHRLTEVRHAVYGARRFAPRGRNHADLSQLPWISPDDESTEYPLINWMQQQGHERQVVLRCSSTTTMAAAVQAGVGVGILSCFVADSMKGLVRLSPLIRETDHEYWVLTHRELRDVARVATVYAHLRKAFSALRPLFVGESARSGRA